MKTRLEVLESLHYSVRYAYNVSSDSAVDALLLDALKTLETMIKAEKVEPAEVV